MSSTTRLHPRTSRLPRRLTALAATSALALAGLAALAAPASADGVCGAPVVSGATTTITCSAAGTGSITVPADVSSATVTLDGAGGGNASDGTPGGKGAHIVATIPVTPGQVFQVSVGARGANAASDPGFGTAGYGGGLVAVETAASAPLLTAGSGGAAGGPGVGTPAYPGTPGADSGSAGANGTGDAGVVTGGTGGGAGTATAGGAGGAGGTGTYPGGAGSAGGFPNALGATAIANFVSPAGAGGRGGAGYGGGGRGGAGGSNGIEGTAGIGGAGGAGGGGSDFVSGTLPGSPVTVVDGANAGNGQIVFAFTQDTPTVTAVSPDTGPPAGGNTVTVTGTNLTGATITFGTNPATGVTCTVTSCTVTAPAGTAPDTVDVQATTAYGTSTTSAADQYTYAAADLGVALAATGVPGLLNGHINYTITITNNGPSALVAATITATLPTPMTATSSDCTPASGLVTCTLGALASGASTTRSFTAPIGLLTLGLPYAVTTTRTASTPVDLNPANDSATRTCTVVTSLIINCS